MVFIKKLVIQGFKSFAKRTEIVFDKGINVILGPNGSGKSNISDALCFVLGRLSVKSMRAAKAKNLIFMGSKFVKPSKEAYVELVFDNSDKAISIEKDEVIIKRSVRYNGQSVYKINDEVKTRAEIIELLAQAGIDPHGFNMVLQGQIQSVVKMHPEDRRKIIEEVAGIAIYESRKEKSLHELEKTEEKLKEISSILRERTSYLKNLEKEKAQAEKFKDLELLIKRSKFSIVTRKLHDKKKEIESMDKSIEDKNSQKLKIRALTDSMQIQIEQTNEKINQINKHIQQATGFEQESLHNQIANLKAELEGLRVKKESYEHRKVETERRIEEVSKNIPSLEAEIKDLKTKSPTMAKKSDNLKKKKEELSKIEIERKQLLSLKAELFSIKDRIKDKERYISSLSGESNQILQQLEDSSSNLSHKNEEECVKFISHCKNTHSEKNKLLHELEKAKMDNSKLVSVYESEIERAFKIKEQVKNIDVCPLCQSKMDSNHINHVFKDSDDKILQSKEQIGICKDKLDNIDQERTNLIKELRLLDEKINQAQIDLYKHKSMKDRKDYLRRILENKSIAEKELIVFDERRKNLESKTFDSSKLDELYDTKIREIEEISSSTEEDVDTSMLYKQREIEEIQSVIKRSKENLEELNKEIKELSNSLSIKHNLLSEKEVQEKELTARFKKMFEDRENLQIELQETNLNLSEKQSEIRQVEEQVNYLKVGKARLDAEKETFEFELKDFPGLEIIQGSINYLEERLKKAQEDILHIGSINMRALEVYDTIKAEYDQVQEKVNILSTEKEEIMKIIEEIDRKKTRTFMKTFRDINELFSTNFAKLYTKGVAFLELENKESMFEGGVNIVVKLAKGKYFDVTSLSGGEQTLVALSLLFAIQEYKPYHFYIFDEIDAALDKRNSERLAALLQQYMKSGQYIVVTHNDAIILNSNILYGVSMHEGVSKILSLKVNENQQKPEETQTNPENPPQ